MLGESVKRRLGGRARSKTAPPEEESGPRWTRRHWLTVLAGLTLPFGIGYLIAVWLLFPAPEVVAQGITVPDLTGKTAEAAERDLAGLGLGDLTIMELPSPAADEGRIIAQSPLPGQQLRAGAGMRVAVSSGRPRVTVPDVVGFPVERAASLLTRLGFEVQRVDEPSFSEAGRVIRVEPDAGTDLTLPSRVTIVISAGVDSLQVDTTARQDTLLPSRLVMNGERKGWSGTRRAPLLREPQRPASQRASR